jgi:hypothetical protein
MGFLREIFGKPINLPDGTHIDTLLPQAKEGSQEGVSPPDRPRGEEIDLNEEEEAALDRAWAKLYGPALNSPMNLEGFLASFAGEMNDLAGRTLLTWAYFLDGCWNGSSWLHARMFGALVRSVNRPCIPMVEVRWSQCFIPDLCIVDEKDRTIGVIEYESTNSSDERLMEKDLVHFERAILEYETCPAELPGWWLLISSLPNRPVRNWPWYSYPDYPPYPKSKQVRDADPLTYYEDALHNHLSQMWGRIAARFGGPPPTKIVWANLDGAALTVLSVNGERQHGQTTFPLRLAE